MSEYDEQRAQARADFIGHVRMEGDCMIWVGQMSSGNAPEWLHPSQPRAINARRWLWVDEGYELPEGRRLQNACGNPCCVLPGHQKLSSGRRLKGGRRSA